MTTKNPPSSTVIDSFIAAATNLVDNVLGTDTTLGKALLKEIERWLTAHLVTITLKRIPASAGAGGASIKYTGEWGEGLSSSPYGQTVLLLDTTGNFASLSMSRARLIAIPSFSGS
jgi:hypothetical protein